MNGTACHCAPTLPCGCCDGVTTLTPEPVANRPGLPALQRRVGTHGSFLASMQARLSTATVAGRDTDGQPLPDLRPLKGLTTRSTGDPALALLDAWATVGDVLTFYQERIANEGYLRTATERRSVLEMARLVGYALRPGVAATVYLAYTLDDNQKEPVTIPAGSRAQSVPDPDETAQTFETAEDMVARREWNNLQVRLSRPADVHFGNALTVETLQVEGVATNLKAGDRLLLLFSADASMAAVRTVARADTRFADQRTAVTLRPVVASPALVTAWAEGMWEFRSMIDGKVQVQAEALRVGQDLLRRATLGVGSPPLGWAAQVLGVFHDNAPTPLKDFLVNLGARMVAVADGDSPVPAAVTTPERFVAGLLRPAVPQVRNSLRLTRNLTDAFLALPDVGGSAVAAGTASSGYADAGTQLLVGFAPTLARSFYAAWSGARLDAGTSPLLAVHVFRSRSVPFGALAPGRPTEVVTGGGSGGGGVILKAAAGTPAAGDWDTAGDERNDNVFLDQSNDAVVPGSYALADTPTGFHVLRVADAAATPRTAYGISGPSTRLQFDGTEGWRDTAAQPTIAALRRTQLYVQSEPLHVLDEPLVDDVGGTEIALADLHRELKSGRWVVLSGERTDIPDVSGVTASELMMVSNVVHAQEPGVAGDRIHTTLTLATPTAYRYRRDTLRVHGNVVRATHGETRQEVLGSGNGALALQAFTLRQPPLTFVPAPTAEGAATTLQVRVNDVAWHETGSLAWLGPQDHGFAVFTDDAGVTHVAFGNGEHGARLPTGVQNVRAVYRNGIGRGGNVKAGQVTLLQTRPLGVKEVINPLRASGGADRETRDLARQNAPLSVMSLDRLVSVRDYADFTRRFAGIAKAKVLRTSDGVQQIVQLTIAGVDDAPIDRSSDLYRNLLEALHRWGDAELPLRVDPRDLKALVLSANVRLLPDFDWEAVAPVLRDALLETFGFARRALGQPALLCEAIATLQRVRGVSHVDVDAWGAISQTRIDADADGHLSARLLTQDEIVDAVRDIVDRVGGGPGGQPADVDVWPGGPERGVMRPAELAIFLPGVPDTLILNPLP